MPNPKDHINDDEYTYIRGHSKRIRAENYWEDKKIWVNNYVRKKRSESYNRSLSNYKSQVYIPPNMSLRDYLESYTPHESKCP